MLNAGIFVLAVIPMEDCARVLPLVLLRAARAVELVIGARAD